MFLTRTPVLLLAFFLALTAASTGVARTLHVRNSPLRPTQEPLHVATDVKAVAREFNGWLDTVEQSDQVSGLAVAIVKDDKVLLQRGIGYADASKAAPITPDSVFRLASLSKAFASALTAMLIDEGMLSWDTRVAGVLPTFELQNVAASSKLTVRDILSQRVGLPHNTYDGLLEQDAPYQELVEKLREVPMACDVGDCYGYQNITFALIGDITYAVSGDFFYHQVEKRIFHPLGMDTATYGRAALEASASWARPHARRGHGWTPIAIKESYYHVPPAAGVNASIKDMTQWLIAQMGERPDVLPEALLTTLHTPLVETPGERRATPWRSARLRDASYALGWRVYDYAGETLIYHAGAVQGYRSIIAFFPDHRFGAVMLWNCECALPSGLMPMLLDRYLGLGAVDWAGIETSKRAHLVAGGSR
ncbi:MAG: serine hydrolase [Rudaea sp.]|nr:serine hydrolase [Rudaea sp.]